MFLVTYVCAGPKYTCFGINSFPYNYSIIDMFWLHLDKIYLNKPSKSESIPEKNCCTHSTDRKCCFLSVSAHFSGILPQQCTTVKGRAKLALEAKLNLFNVFPKIVGLIVTKQRDFPRVDEGQSFKGITWSNWATSNMGYNQSPLY